MRAHIKIILVLLATGCLCAVWVSTRAVEFVMFDVEKELFKSPHVREATVASATCKELTKDNRCRSVIYSFVAIDTLRGAPTDDFSDTIISSGYDTIPVGSRVIHYVLYPGSDRSRTGRKSFALPLATVRIGEKKITIISLDRFSTSGASAIIEVTAKAESENGPEGPLLIADDSGLMLRRIVSYDSVLKSAKLNRK